MQRLVSPAAGIWSSTLWLDGKRQYYEAAYWYLDHDPAWLATCQHVVALYTGQ